jgi:hypothetical protein
MALVHFSDDRIPLNEYPMHTLPHIAMWIKCWCTILHLHLQHRQHTSHEEETSNNRRKTKSLHCPQLDHHDTDGLAGHKTWRTTQITMRRYKCALRKSAHSSWYFNMLYIVPLFYGEFCWFYIFFLIFIFNLITCIRNTSRSTDVQHITSLYQIVYVQRIRHIKNSPSNN